MAYHYIWLNSNPNLAEHLRRANEDRSAAVYAALKRLRHAFSSAGLAAANVAEWLRRKHREHVAIRELYALDERTLKDIGVPRGEIRAVAAAYANGVAEPRTQVAAGPSTPTDTAAKRKTTLRATTRPVWLRGVVDGGQSAALPRRPGAKSDRTAA